MTNTKTTSTDKLTILNTEQACTPMESNKHVPTWDIDLIRKYDISGPRYTSYPTAPQLREGFTRDHWLECAKQSNQTCSPLSLYFHIPFCDTVCYYCGCNKIITANKKRAEPYVTALLKEISMQAQHIDSSRQVQQIHFGGGTPTYLSNEQLKKIVESIRSEFNLADDNELEFSIEIHPQSVTPERIEFLRNLGFNRMSLGIQDFDPEVQKAVNRFNSEEEVKALITSARDCAYRSISLDLIYGLPRQTHQGFLTTLDKIIALDADRLSLFNYAHMPNLFKVQSQIDAKELPEPQTKLAILHDSIEKLCSAGYQFIGMDHFAKPTDELSIAQQNKTLQRNFQGYSTGGNCELYGFGVSSIAHFGGSYIQNYKTIEDYYTCINSDQLPSYKSIKSSIDDDIRRFVINALICHFEVSFIEFKTQFQLDFKTYFESELTEIKELAKDGLVTLSDEKIEVCDVGRLLVRRVCQVFDAYIQKSNDINKQSKSVQYSRII